jgi:hypothetical protein
MQLHIFRIAGSAGYCAAALHDGHEVFKLTDGSGLINGEETLTDDLVHGEERLMTSRREVTLTAGGSW